MATPDDPRKHPPISPELRRAIAADRIGCFVDEPVLGGEDTEILRLILEGELEPDFAVSRKRAIGTLARSEPSQETADLLGRILIDPKAPKSDRAVAAAWIGQLPSNLAERSLLQALPKAQGPLRVEILEALARTGSKEALAQLDCLDPEQEELAGRSLVLARTLARLRVSPGAITAGDLDEALGIRWSEAASSPLEPGEARKVAATLPPQPYGIELDRETGFAFTCDGVPHVVLLNAELGRGAVPQVLTRRAMIAGLVVSRPERVERYAVRWVLLTSPGERSVRLILVRPNGEPVLVGDAERRGEGLDFSLRDTGVERVPAEVRGRIGESAIGWTVRTWQGPRRPKRSPLPIMLPAAR